MAGNLTIKFHVARLRMYIDNFERIRNGYHFEYTDKNRTISLFNDKNVLIEKTRLRPDILFELKYSLTPWGIAFKKFSKKFNIVRKDNDMVGNVSPLKYYLLKLPAIFTAPATRLIETIRILYFYFMPPALDLEFTRLQNGFEVITNTDLEAKIQSRFEKEKLLLKL
jgi:hypothetical protein